MPTTFNLEYIIGVDKETKEEDYEFIPLKSRFIAALRRMAFCMVSSSVVEDPSSATVCLVLHLGVGAQGTIRSGGDGEAALPKDADDDGEGALIGDVGGV
jgi:hypothetical protein